MIVSGHNEPYLGWQSFWLVLQQIQGVVCFPLVRRKPGLMCSAALDGISPKTLVPVKNTPMIERMPLPLSTRHAQVASRARLSEKGQPNIQVDFHLSIQRSPFQLLVQPQYEQEGNLEKFRERRLLFKQLKTAKTPGEIRNVGDVFVLRKSFFTFVDVKSLVKASNTVCCFSLTGRNLWVFCLKAKEFWSASTEINL